ncbi:hypothetical protein MMC28_002105 [Mycoblastus sanguinarius]|nr:hypothetical protein [Mycoblastus sanguinarius]
MDLVLSRLDVPHYLHPTYPPIQALNETGGLYTPDNDDDDALPLKTAAWLGTLAGVFDQFPDLKLVLGHMGEMLPYMLTRSNSLLGPTKTRGASLPETYARNVWVTTSGFFSLDPFATVLKTTARDRIMFSVDYPWATNEDGVRFMEGVEGFGNGYL